MKLDLILKKRTTRSLRLAGDDVPERIIQRAHWPYLY